MKSNMLRKLAPTLVLSGALCVALAACSPETSTETSKSTADEGATYTADMYPDREALVEATANVEEELGYNPHGMREQTGPFVDDPTHFDDIENCQLCHAAGDDGENMLWCTTCHIGMTMPEGWVAYPVVPGDDVQEQPATAE